MADFVEQDPGGSVLPESEAPLDAERQLQGIEAGLHDPALFGDLGVISEPTIVVDETPKPVGHGWAWDFETNRFALGAGRRPLLIQGDEVLKQRLTMRLITDQGAHEIYSADYGMERANDVIGRSINDVLASDFPARIEQALLGDPKVLAVEDIEFSVDEDDEEALVGSFTVRKDDEDVIGLRAAL